MKTRSFLSQTLGICSLALLFNGVAVAVVGQQDKNKPKVSEAEIKAVSAVESAPDINAKMAAAEEFLKKYPKSASRVNVAKYMLDQVEVVTDANQKLALAQKYQATFTDKTEIDSIKPALIDAYVKLNRFDEAFAEGATQLAKNADDIQILVMLAITGVEQAKKQNPKYADASRQYGARAIELFEGDKKPAAMDAEAWAREKTMLPQVYQEMAVISLMQQNLPEAQGKLEKAARLNPADPFNYMLLGSIANDDYQKVAQTYKSMPEGKAKDEMMQKINGLLDKVIDHYAHAVGLSEGKPQYQQFHDQILQDLTSYYRYRHNNSTEGLQKLIDGYKLP